MRTKSHNFLTPYTYLLQTTFFLQIMILNNLHDRFSIYEKSFYTTRNEFLENITRWTNS